MDKLLGAFSQLKQENPLPRWKLYIAGDGQSSYIQSLKDLAHEYGLTEHIDWVGYVAGAEKSRLLNDSDWFVLPSMSENFGLAVVEALSYGVPVIISEEVGISKIIKESHAGIICDDTVGLVDALETALKGVPPEMKRAATILVKERFSWTRIGKELAEFYNIQIADRRK